MKTADTAVALALAAVLVGTGYSAYTAFFPVGKTPTAPSGLRPAVAAQEPPPKATQTKSPPKHTLQRSDLESAPSVRTGLALGNPPELDVDSIRSRSDALDGYGAGVEMEAMEVYDRLHAQESPGYAEGRRAIQVFVLQNAISDIYGLGWFQCSAVYAKAAREKGLRDPLVDAIEGTFCLDCPNYCGRAETHKDEHRQAVLRLDKSPYPPSVKMPVLVTAMANLKKYRASKPQNTSVLAYGPKFRGAGLRYLEEILRTGTAPPRVLRGKAIDLAKFTTYDGGIREKYEREIEKVLALGNPPPMVLPAVRGQMLIDRAWHSRGGGWANTVSAEGWNGMALYLSEAERVLETGWKEFPQAAVLPELLMSVELGQGRGKDRMERYFQGAIQADPGRFEPHRVKMLYLQPRWYGSSEEVIAFGKECLEKGDWHTNVPIVLMKGMDTLKDMHPDIWSDARVQKLLRSMYAKYLERHPDSIWYRGCYLKFLVEIGDYEEGRKQDALLGDWWDLRQFSHDERSEIREKLGVN